LDLQQAKNATTKHGINSGAGFISWDYSMILKVTEASKYIGVSINTLKTLVVLDWVC